MASEGSQDTGAQQGSNPTGSVDGWTGAAENHGPNTEHSAEQVQEPSMQLDPVHNIASGDSAGIDEDDDEDAGEYDPESVTITTSAPPHVERSASAASSRPLKKPKTAGGFIVGSSDDEDDDTPAPAPTPSTLKPTPTEAQARPFGQSPFHQSTTPQDTSSYGSAQASSNSIPAATTAAATTPTVTVNPNVAVTGAGKSRLPTDSIGILENRVKEDPRGDVEAWLALIDEQKRRHKVDDARSTYERFLEIFPQAAEIWVAYIDMELSLDNFTPAETIFSRTLMRVHNVQLWTTYLNYVRRRNDLNNDPSGAARQVLSQSYEFVLNNIGQDKDAGSIWQDYIQFLKTGPGQLGGTNWQDQQKMDQLRKAYQRAIGIPMANLNALWKEYDQFEMGLNRQTGRKKLQERSPAYMTARSANTHLENITRGLQRTTVPRLPPAPGFGDQDYMEQVRLWKAWIAWEKEDPLVLKSEDAESLQQRILHVYSQALMALRFWPELWIEAAEWCFDNKIFGKDGQDLGLQFLVDGIAANPESSVLALKHADHIELTQRDGEDDGAKAALAQAVRAPFDKVLDALYEMVKKLKEREAAAIAKIEEDASTDLPDNGRADGEDDDEGEILERPSLGSFKQERIKAVQDGFAVQVQMLSQHISYLWIALARAFRRLQGQGKSQPPTGVRGIFTEARGRGRLTSDVYIAIAHIEWDVYQDPVATKIFERGAKLFPESEQFFVEQLKHLHARRDFTNARVAFSQTVQRFKQKPELISKLKPLFAYFHAYEAKYGELVQVRELEKQMAELFPEESNVAHFAARFASDTFNPITARVIISPAQQMSAEALMQSVERRSPSVRSSPPPVPQMERSPRPQFLPVNTNSPKRPFQVEEQDDYNPPRKLARGASPLKGAAGRRLDQQRRAKHGQGMSTSSNAPAPIPRDITFLIGLIPPAETLSALQFKTEGLVRLVRETHVPDYQEWKALYENGQARTQTKQASLEYPPYPYPGRDSAGVAGRPQSPYNGTARALPPTTTAYRNSSLRPGSSGSYEPPPAVYQNPGPSQFNPLAHSSGADNHAYAAWQNNYSSAPNPYGMPPPQQPYGGYY